MDDNEIIELYWARKEVAIEETSLKYGGLCTRIAQNILSNYEDSKECVNDTYPAAITSFEELGDCVSGIDSVESEAERKQVESMIDKFLWQQREEKRSVFIRRYWYFDSIESICQSTGFSKSKVKSLLYEMRQKLRTYLESEGIEV